VLNPFTHRKVLKNGRPGRANIVTMGALDRGGTSFNLPMTLHVYVEGLTPYEVHDQWMVKAKDTVALSGSIPVKVDPDDQEKVAIDWDTLRAEYEQEAEARRAALAQSGPVGPNVTVGEPQVIDLSGDPEAAAQVQQMLGQFGISVEQAGTGAASDDDPISKLERLAALRASGALTEAEFEEQKRRILGDA
jgi:putative oligomerization/nucleic acid binding protein